MATDTYTQPGGNSPQNTALQSLITAMNSMPNMSPEAASALQGYVGNATAANSQNYANQQQQNVVSNPAVTQPAQSYSNDADLFKMFVADHQLSSQFTNPAFASTGQPTTQSSDMPTTAGLANPLMPVATPTSLAQGFTGFTNPANAYAAAHLQGQGISDTMSTIQKLLDFNLGQLNKTADTNTTSQKNISDQFLKLVDTAIQNNSNGVGKVGSPEYKLALNNQITADASKGVTLPDLIKKYSPQLDGQTIFNLYNAAGYYKDSKGQPKPLVQTTQQLENWGIKVPTATQKAEDAQVKTDQAYQQTKDNIQTLISNFDDIYNKAALKGPYLGPISTKIPGSLEQEYERQRLGLTTVIKETLAASGIRVTQTELNYWSNLLPSISKSQQQNDYDKVKLNSLIKAKFGGKGLDPQYLPSKTPSASPVPTPTPSANDPAAKFWSK